MPRISIPSELTSRPGWIHPIRYLLRSSFERNKNDTSPRLVTSALKSGYRFLALLTRAQDVSSPQHAQVVTFLRDRQASFPPPPPAPAEPAEPKPERPRPPPLLTRVSAPGEPPVYKSTVRPLPLAQLSGGVRKVPVFDDTGNIGFLRIGKPQSHWHANFLRRKGDRRQARITAMQELLEEGRRAAAEEDEWDAMMARIGARDDDGGDGLPNQGRGGANPRGRPRLGPFERTVMEFGVEHLSTQLDEDMRDVQARATAMLDIIDAERELAEREKREKKERRRKAWEQRQSEQVQPEGQAQEPGNPVMSALQDSQDESSPHETQDVDGFESPKG